MEYRIEAKTDKNRLYIILKGVFNEDGMKEASDKVLEEAKKLQPGFDVINDISRFAPGTEKGLEHIQRAQAFVKEKGSKRIVRVVKPEGFGDSSKEKFRSSEQTVAGYESMEVTSVEDAERLLDGESLSEAS